MISLPSLQSNLSVNLRSRLRFAVANPQPVPLLAALLVFAVAAVQLFVVPRMEAAMVADEAELVRLERTARRAAIERQEITQASPSDTRQRLLGHFAVESELNSQLGRLFELASAAGLQIPTGDYRLVKGKEDALFDRYVLNFPVKGQYDIIRRYLLTVRRTFPGLAIEDVSLRRESIGSAELEAQLRFVLFSRRDSGVKSP